MVAHEAATLPGELSVLRPFTVELEQRRRLDAPAPIKVCWAVRLAEWCAVNPHG
jgi:hypothetical protein